MPNFLRQLFAITVKDSREFFAVKLRLFFSIIFPLMFIFMIGSIFPSTSAFEGIQVAVYDLDEGFELSPGTNIKFGKIYEEIFRELTDGSLYKTIDFNLLTPTVTNENEILEEAREQVLYNNYKAIIVIPRNFTSVIFINQSSKIITYVDPSNPTISSIMGQEVSRTLTLANEALSNQTFTRLYPNTDSNLVSFAKRPVALELGSAIDGSNSLENINSFSYVAPGFIAMIVMITGLTSVGAVITREKEVGTFDGLMVAPVSRTAILLGKVTFISIRSIFQGILILILAVLLFNIDVKGNPLLILFVLIVSSISFLGMGVLLSAYTSDQESAQMMIGILQFPMMFLSGVFFPIEQFPSEIQFISNLIPLTYAVDALRKIMILGVTISGAVLIDLIIIIALGAITLIMGVPLFERATKR
ncbi:MAG: ABC transporter permease [Candidatus Hodarchaeales archaeon]